MKESFVGDPITPADKSFSTASMAAGEPGLPQAFIWQGREVPVLEVIEKWKTTGDCRHGSGERYVRKHWFRIRTSEAVEMKIYFERQARSRRGSRWRLYSIRSDQPTIEARP